MQSKMPKSSGIYIHFPFCKVKCGYCDFYSIVDKENSVPAFIDSLIAEIELYFNKFDTSEYTFDTLFLGGGTPSLIPTKDIDRIFNKLSNYIIFSDLEEITMEANPGEAPLERLKEYNKSGVNRISFGFQSLDDHLLKFLDRLHLSTDCFRAFEDARTAGFKNINTDMIFNIPGQSLKTLNSDLNSVIELEPEHISCYSLTVESGTMLDYNVRNKIVTMPNEELDRKMYQAVTNTLNKSLYTQYEVSNYAKDDLQCMHNLHYWNLNPYLAFGPSAHGYDGKRRWWNHKSLDRYITDVNNGVLPINNSETLTRRNHYNEIIMNGLRTSRGVDIKSLLSINNKLNAHELSKNWPQLIIDNNYLKLNNNDFMLLDEISSDLFI